MPTSNLFVLLFFKPGVGLAVTVAGLRPMSPEFQVPVSVELIPGGVDSPCHPSQVGEMTNVCLFIFQTGCKACSGAD